MHKGLGVWYLAVVLPVLCAASSLAVAYDNEDQLLARLKTEQNPVRKAKLEIKLGDLKLLEAIAAYGKLDPEGGAKLLDAFLDHRKSAWKVLQLSGRKAAKQPQGFKELDIALREDVRALDDLAHKTAYDDRGPIEKCAKEIEAIRAEVLQALFPSPGPKSGHHSASPQRFAVPAAHSETW